MRSGAPVAAGPCLSRPDRIQHRPRADPGVDRLGFGLVAESADSDKDLGGLLRLGFEMDGDTLVGGVPQ